MSPKKPDDVSAVVEAFGDVVKLRESLAVQTSHVQRLMAEKHVLLSHIRDLNGRIVDLERAMLAMLRGRVVPAL